MSFLLKELAYQKKAITAVVGAGFLVGGGLSG